MCETADCVTPSSAAARVRLPSSAAFKKASYLLTGIYMNSFHAKMNFINIINAKPEKLLSEAENLAGPSCHFPRLRL